MRICNTAIAGAFRIVPQPSVDGRGFFARTYCFESFREAGVPFGAIRQGSVSHNARKGTLRGMHWQTGGKPEGKLVRVIQGRIFDVIIDVRRDSPSYGKWLGRELDGVGQEAVVVPAGCAHGFLTLEDNSTLEYAMDQDYEPALSSGARWNDSAFHVTWPATPDIVSERDRNWPDFVL